MNKQPHHAGYNRKSVLEDVGIIASRMRQADIDEINAVHPKVTVEDALHMGYLTSEPCNTMVQTEGDLPCGMWGIVPAAGEKGVGYVWMLGTDELVETPKNARRFLVGCKRDLPLILDVYPLLTNMIDSRNLVHLKFIEWLGFEVDTANAVLINDVRFYPFKLTIELYNKRWSKNNV